MARIVSIDSATIDTVALDGVVSATFSEAVAERIGQSDGEFMETSVNIAGFSGSGNILTDDHDNDLTVLDGGIKVLVITYKKAGGTTGTITIGALTPSKYGVVFTAAQEVVYDIGESGGPTTRQQLDFTIVGLDTHTQLVTGGTSTGPIVIT